MDQDFIQKEKAYLQRVLGVLEDNVRAIEEKRATMADSMVAHRREIWENVGNVDEYEQAGEETAAELNSDRYVMLTQQADRLRRQSASPYFGKIDFGPNSKERINFYIGLGEVSDNAGRSYVIDWRAPVADLYYNNDLGEAQYVAPRGTIRGTIYNKYQYKIENGEMKYVIDTSTTILDEVLMQELSKNASPLMRNIAATIQKEQNKIIRHPFGENLLIQGVAGSGKTSIALHRIAYILYHCRSTIRAKEVMIITPNKAFTGYIGNVLPELGEEMVPQYSMEDLAAAELRKICSFERRAEHLDALYNGEPMDGARVASMRVKADPAFAKDLESFAKNVDKLCFKPRDFMAGSYTCPKSTFESLYFKRFAHYPQQARMRKIVEYVQREMASFFHSKLSTQLALRVQEMVMSMYTRYDVLSLYRRFLSALNRRGKAVLLPDPDKPLPYEDVFGVLLMKYLVEGTQFNFSGIKHLVVDEMQDYTPTQYAYLNHLFSCPKTVLGDLQQIADPYLNIGELETIYQLMGGECDVIDLHTSYRSSYEISHFASRFSGGGITAIDRHDDPVELVGATSYEDRLAHIRRALAHGKERGFDSTAIIARTISEARALKKELADWHPQLLLDGETPYHGGVIITTAIAIKGFEFDQVILPNVSKELYHSAWDKNLLYISSTRALHSLSLFYEGEPSLWLQEVQYA